MTAEQWVALGLAVIALALIAWAHVREADRRLQAHIDDVLALIDADRRDRALEANKAARWHG